MRPVCCPSGHRGLSKGGRNPSFMGRTCLILEPGRWPVGQPEASIHKVHWDLGGQRGVCSTEVPSASQHVRESVEVADPWPHVTTRSDYVAMRPLQSIATFTTGAELVIGMSAAVHNVCSNNFYQFDVVVDLVKTSRHGELGQMLPKSGPNSVSRGQHRPQLGQYWVWVLRWVGWYGSFL